MNNNNERSRQVKFTELPVEYSEPKKSHKIISAAAGVAGAAAVLTGAVFGLNWLNEHGGLKGPDVRGAGAGYHADVTEQLSADADDTDDVADVLASFVFDGFTVNVTYYDFDGISLEVYYDVIFADNCTLSSGEKQATVVPMIRFSEENAAEGNVELISETDNTQSCVYRTTLEAYTEALTVDFKPNKEGYAEFGGYPLTVYADHKEPQAKTEVPATFVFKTAAETITVNSYEFDGKTLNLNLDDVFDLGLEKYHDPEHKVPALVNGMKNMDAFSFMGEPDDNIKYVFMSTNSISGSTINRTMTVELEDFAGTVDLIFPPTVHDEFNVPEYTFTVTVNAENVTPAVNEETGKLLYNSGIVSEMDLEEAPDSHIENGDNAKSECIEIDANAKPVNGVVPMDETIELDGMTVHFTGYDYDSQILRVEYDVEYTDGRTNAGRNPLTVINLDGSAGCEHGAWKYERGEESDILHCYITMAIDGTPDYLRIPFGYTVFPEDFPAEPRTEDDELFAITVHYDPDSVIRTFPNDRVKIGDTGKVVIISDAFITPTHISARLHLDEQLTDEFANSITAGLRLKDGRTFDLTNIGIYGYSENSDLYWLIARFDEPTALDEIADANINGFYFSEPDEEYFEMMKAKYPEILSIEHTPLYTPADEWYDCDGKRVHVTGYTFDGVILRLRYETCYDYPLSGDAPAIYGYMLPNKLWDGFAYFCNGECDESRISEGIISETFNVFVTSPVDTLDIPFGDSIFTVHKNDSVPMIEKDIGKEMLVSNDDTVHFDRLVLSSGNLSIAMSGSPYTNDYSSETGTAYLEALSHLQTVITLKNGESINFNQGWNEPAGMGLPNGNGYKFYQFTDPIDINDVVSITVNDMEIYAAE